MQITSAPGTVHYAQVVTTELGIIPVRIIIWGTLNGGVLATLADEANQPNSRPFVVIGDDLTAGEFTAGEFTFERKMSRSRSNERTVTVRGAWLSVPPAGNYVPSDPNANSVEIMFDVYRKQVGG